jgi:hypothetical protein
MLYRDPSTSRTVYSAANTYFAANTYSAAIISTTSNSTATISIDFSTKTGYSTEFIEFPWS